MFDMEGLKGMFGGMQKEMENLQEKAKETILTAKSGGGLVSVSINGAGELVDLHIDESLLEDRESLQILLMSALNDAYKSVEENKKNMALNLLGGMKPFGL